MKRVTLSITAVVLAGFCAGDAGAANCAFNSAPARGVKGSMVRNYAPCPGTEHPTANTETEGGTDACTPVTPAEIDGDGTLYVYGPKGKCTAMTSAKLVKACEDLEDSAGNNLGLQAGPCHVSFVKSKCSGIVVSSIDPTPIGAGDDGWSLATLSRATLADPTNGDMTVIDFPVTFAYSVPDNGKMFVDSSSAEALIPLVGANNADLPPCTSIEIVDTTIKAPGNLPFAKLGGATRP
jgi:hypothetical protein